VEQNGNTGRKEQNEKQKQNKTPWSSPEEGNRSIFRTVVFPSIQNSGGWAKCQSYAASKIFRPTIFVAAAVRLVYT
jgi:hypothetical protein